MASVQADPVSIFPFPADRAKFLLFESLSFGTDEEE